VVDGRCWTVIRHNVMNAFLARNWAK